MIITSSFDILTGHLEAIMLSELVVTAFYASAD